MSPIIIGLLFSLTTRAASLAGVEAPDTAQVGGTALVLNGMGLREKVIIDVYVGSLYLPQKTSSADEAISADVPKRLSMTFIYNTVSKEQLIEAFDEGLSKDPAADAVRERFQQMYGMLATVHSSHEIRFDYVPGAGTTINVRGAEKGTIPGADFMQSLWRIYLGDAPPSGALKRGMLGR